jgi:hypothetical protein
VAFRHPLWLAVRRNYKAMEEYAPEACAACVECSFTAIKLLSYPPWSNRTRAEDVVGAATVDPPNLAKERLLEPSPLKHAARAQAISLESAPKPRSFAAPRARERARTRAPSAALGKAALRVRIQGSRCELRARRMPTFCRSLSN